MCGPCTRGGAAKKKSAKHSLPSCIRQYALIGLSNLGNDDCHHGTQPHAPDATSIGLFLAALRTCAGSFTFFLDCSCVRHVHISEEVGSGCCGYRTNPWKRQRRAPPSIRDTIFARRRSCKSSWFLYLPRISFHVPRVQLHFRRSRFSLLEVLNLWKHASS